MFKELGKLRDHEIDEAIEVQALLLIAFKVLREYEQIFDHMQPLRGSSFADVGITARDVSNFRAPLQLNDEERDRDGEETEFDFEETEHEQEEEKEYEQVPKEGGESTSSLCK